MFIKFIIVFYLLLFKNTQSRYLLTLQEMIIYINNPFKNEISVSI